MGRANSLSQILRVSASSPFAETNINNCQVKGDIFMGWRLPTPCPFANTPFIEKNFESSLPGLCPSLLSIPWAFFTVHITLHLLNRHFAVFWRYLCPFSLTRKCKRAGTMGLISFIFQNAKPEFGALEMHPWGVFQAREYTQLNPWVPL